MIKKATTEQVHPNKLNPPNPTGKGGFGERPENRNPGGWKKEDSISYQYNRFIRMTEDEFKDWEKLHPKSERTVAQVLAYDAVVLARKEIGYLKEITDRVEGKPKQTIEHDGGIDLVIKKLEETVDDLLEDEEVEEDTTPR